MVKIKDDNRIFQTPEEMVSHLLGLLVIMIDKQGGEVILDNLSAHAKLDPNKELVVKWDPVSDSVMLTVKDNIDQSNGSG